MMISAFGVSLSLFLLQAQTIEAFVLPSSTGNCKSMESCNFEIRQSLPREFQTRRFAALDDEDDYDEDDHDDDNGPLAKGLDSVSWLPTVRGAKGDNMPIDSAKEVRFKRLGMWATKSIGPKQENYPSAFPVFIVVLSHPYSFFYREPRFFPSSRWVELYTHPIRNTC